jgi:hypothetical protein
VRRAGEGDDWSAGAVHTDTAPTLQVSEEIDMIKFAIGAVVGYFAGVYKEYLIEYVIEPVKEFFNKHSS